MDIKKSSWKSNFVIKLVLCLIKKFRFDDVDFDSFKINLIGKHFAYFDKSSFIYHGSEAPDRMTS